MSQFRINASLFIVAALGLASAAMGQTGQVYHLRPGSSDQQGCFIGCACFTTNQEPLRGTFVLTPSTPDPVFQNYAISNVQFHAPTFNFSFLGSGTYQVGGDPAALERMQLDMSLEGNPVQHWDSGYAARASSFPAIRSVVTIHNYQCYDIVLTIRASPIRSDWNADGVVSVLDIFDFVNTWLAGDGDANDDGQTGITDVFAFINDWFAGI